MFALSFFAPHLVGQTIPLYSVSSGQIDFDSTLIATGDGEIPTIAGTTSAHRDAAYITGGGILHLLSGADLTIKNDNNLTAFLRVGYGDGQSGTMTIADGASLTVGQPSRYANLQVGEGLGAVGTVTQTGGAVTVGGSFNLGVNGGSGAWTISGGALNLYNGLYNVGFNNLGTGQSSGQFNISGGTVQMQSGNFVIGDRAVAEDGTLGNGNGVVTQSGGTFRIEGVADNNNLFLSSYGNGVYNLNGGALEIGGNHLRGNYLAGTSNYTFNLGGGTIRAYGTALDTNVNATLVANTTSVLDTNGLGATWRGNLTGTGTLRKTGTQSLTLSGTSNSFGVIDVQTGEVIIPSGTTTLTRAIVGVTGSSAAGRLEISGATVNLTGSANADLRTTYIGSGAGNIGEFLLSSGTLNIGLVSTPGTRADFEVGSFQGVGYGTQTGGTLVLNSTGGFFHIGNQGTGTYTLSGGSITTQNAFVLGRSTVSGMGDGTLYISGGTLTLASATKGALIVGGVDASNTVTGGKGLIHQTGGTVSIGAYLELGTKDGTGIYNLYGGTLEIGGAGGIKRDLDGIVEFNLGGGTIKVTGADLTSGVPMTLVDRDASPSVYTKSFINTNSLNATLSGAITGAGTLEKTGAGRLTLTGDNNITGEAYITGGAIAQTAGDSTIRYLGVGSGPGATGTYTLAGGTLSISNTLQVGDWGGVGVMHQTGGTLTINGSFNVGNQGGTGAYTLSGGTLRLTSGLYNIGRNTGANAASTGVFTLSGGLLEVTGGNFILGNRDATATAGNGSGTFTQTGGTFRVSGTDGASNLYLSSYGNGAYNLNGGTLEIGGNHLQAKYGAGSDTYAFTLGGGTLKVIGETLTTSVNATLASGTADNGIASKIDTNGLGAVWSGTLTGAQGGLIKKGTGTLTFSGSGARTIGYLNSDAGRIVQTTGTTTVTEFVVGSNHETKNGAFTLSGGTLTLAGSTTASPTPSFRIGDWGGTGQFDQTGGTLHADSSVLLGNRAGTGTYNLSGGVLLIGENAAADSSALILGRSRAADGAVNSTGTFNASGGTLRLFADAPLLVGGDSFGVADSGRAVGTFTQSGTALVTIDSFLSLAAHGTGTYNLNGGTLQVGGGSGIRKGTGTAAFNFGGGTLQVYGSDLTSSVPFSLTAGTAGTLDTDGRNATLSGNLTATGTRIYSEGGNQFTKADLGTLTLSGSTRSLNTFVAQGGAVAQTAGGTSALEFVVGSGSGSTATFTLSGGSLTVNASTALAGGAVAGALRIGSGGGAGIFTQTAGTVLVSATSGGALTLGYQGGAGTYNLLGGTLQLGGADGLRAGTGTAAFNLGGGKLQVAGSSLSTALSLTLLSGTTSTLDTNGFTATLSGNLTATGTHQVDHGGNKLTKAGLGTLALSGNTRTLDTFAIEAGSVMQTAGATTAVEFMVGTGAGNSGAFALSAGSFTIQPSITAGGEPVAGILRVGDFGGTGAFTQNGGAVLITADGALNIGNQGGTGTYTLAGGTLTLGGGVNTLARSSSGQAASSGTLNISGGTLALSDSSALVVGNSLSGAGVALGAGTITQTGGRVVVEAGSHVYVAGFGNGSYTLAGGTLEVGGTGLQARYNNNTSTYAFTLAGGTVQVAGSALTAALDATLANATTSKIDTAGFGATWSGALTGSGGLEKIGAGTLALTHAANTFSGGLKVSAGSLLLAGNLTNSAITVGNGATLLGTGSAAGLTLQNGAFLSPGGEAAGTFTIAGNATLLAGSRVIIGLGAGSYDLLSVSGLLTFGGTLELSAAPGFSLVEGASFDLFDFGSAAGSFSALSLPSLGSALRWDTSQLYTQGMLTIGLAAVPEPGMWATLVGAVALAFALWRGRRK